MKIEEEKLDNPVWNSLNEAHSKFSIEYDGMKFYRPEYCPFGGFIKLQKTSNAMDDYSANEISNFYVVGEKPHYKNKLVLAKNLVCNQMVLAIPIAMAIKEEIVELKSHNQKKDLSKLVNLVQPGYFNSKTSDLGKYFGIYKNNQLVSVAGERMKMDKYTEVSAIVTHLKHTRKGYSKQLIMHTTNHILSENKIPYLHVATSNKIAITLYEKLGFSTRRKISFWNFKVI